MTKSRKRILRTAGRTEQADDPFLSGGNLATERAPLNAQPTQPPPFSWAPRALSRVRAAAYLDISPGTFDVLVRSGKLPKPRCFAVSEGCRPMMRWDRHELDTAFEELGHEQEENPWES